MSKRFFVRVLLLAVLLALAAGSAYGANARAFDAKAFGLRGNYLVAGEAKGVLETGGKEARVRLIAQRDKGETFNRAFLLEVVPPGEKPFIVRLPENAGGFEPKMELRPFTVRGNSEVFLAIQTGGSGGIVRSLVVGIEKRQGKTLYDSETVGLPEIRGRFLDGYKAAIGVRPGGPFIILDLVPRKELYDKDGVYDPHTGRVAKPVDVWGGGFGLMEAADVDGDGLYELRGVTGLSGEYHADRVAQVETVLKYESGKWHVANNRVTPASDLKIMKERKFDEKWRERPHKPGELETSQTAPIAQ